MDFINHIQKEWDVVSAAPFTFMSIIIFAFAANYLWHRERITRLKEQIAIRDADLAYLKGKTGSDDVRAIAQRLAAVEEELKKAVETGFAKQFSISDLPRLP